MKETYKLEVGHKIGMMTYLGDTDRPVNDTKKQSYCLAKCDCGNTKVLVKSDYKRGNYKSCGCNRTPRKTFDYRGTTLYETWKGMRARCNNKNHIAYKNYGGRGIKVCDRWNDFLLFLQDMGETHKNNLVLDRINNDGNYEPSNCHWVTPKDNGRKTRRVKMSIEKAEEVRLSNEPTRVLAQRYGVCMATIQHIKTNRIWAK